MDLDRLLIHADTAPGVGAGHFVRCLALAEAGASAGFAVELVTDSVPAGFRSVEDTDRLTVTSISGQSGLDAVGARCGTTTWTVLDSYRWTPGELANLRSACRRLAVIADHGTPAPAADLVIDQNEGADPARYAGTGAVVLAGARFALLRSPFVQARRDGLGSPGSRHRAGLVMAGGDPSPAVVAFWSRLLWSLDRVPVDVVGAGFDQVDLPPNVRRLGFVTDPVDLMAGRPWAVSASGSTTWELCCLGVPMVLVAVAPNQEPVGRAAAKRGAAEYLGSIDDLNADDAAAAVVRLINDEPRQSAMSRCGEALVDGLGARRVATELRAATISLRDATMDDAPLLHRWANDPEVRAASFSSDPIPWPEHERWVRAQLADPDAWMLIGHCDEEPIGQIRFDRLAPDRLRVGVSLAPAARGRRLAAPLIVAGTREALGRSGASTVVAEVKPDNHRSSAAFVAAGYQLLDQSDAKIRFGRTADQPSTRAF